MTNDRLDHLEETVRMVIGRVYRLEKQVEALSKEAAGPEAALILTPAPPPPAPPPVEAPRPAPVIRPAPAPPPSAPSPVPQVSWAERIRERLAGEEWEAVIGGSWMNKVGVLVLVIGIALFVAYSLSHLGPAGRVVLGFAGSLAMLAGGVVLERRAPYVIYARGLIGGGWAALYFTTYAAHAIEAARVLSDPFTAAVLLAAVAAGMILHSLRYRSEAVTALAYFLGFIALAITPLTAFTVAALIPLAASLLYVAHRFSWNSMAAGGLLATYGVYLASVAHAVGGSLAAGQSVLFVYWLLFEGFDLLDAARRRAERGIAHTVLPLNILAFVGISSMQWSAKSEQTLYLCFTLTAAAYLASALARVAVRPPSSFSQDADTLDRAWAGSYEGAITIAAGLAAVGIFLRFSGLTITLALLIEAEVVFLAGLVFRQSYLRWLSAAVFLLPVCKLVAFDIAQGGERIIAGRKWLAWSPLALLTAAVFYVNRGLLRTVRYYGYAAAALMIVVLGHEVPAEWVGPGWLLLATVLLEIGLREGLDDFRHQAYLAGVLSLGTLAVVNVLGVGIQAERPAWLPQAVAALTGYAVAGRLLLTARQTVRDVSSAVGTAMLAALLWNILPAPLVAVAWALQSLLLIELNFVLPVPFLRTQGHLVGALAFGRLFLANFTGAGATGVISHRILTVLPVIALHYYLYSRLRDQAARVYLYSAAVLLAVLMRFELGRVLTVDGWAVFALLLVVCGIRWKNPDLRWQSYVLALAAFVRSWTTNFYSPESLAGMSGRILSGAIVIASFYAGQYFSPRRQAAGAPGGPRLLGWLDWNARVVFSLLATALLALLLFYEVSGSLLTVAWGLEGVALLGVGFPARERSLRLSGLLLFLICILKLFFYDLRNLETPYRIASFLVLGVLLLGVSWIYTQFRERIRRYL